MDKKRSRAVRITAIGSILVVLILACATGGLREHRASAEQLQRIEGIGPNIAAAIIVR